MSKTMLVNVTHVEESRVAVLDDGVLSAYEIETINRTNLKGNIHNAVVESVHPSLEAAFVRIGPDLKGFLPIDEINHKLLPIRTDNRKNGKIGQHIHQGQKLMVQVVREPFSGKPPTISTYFSLPGRHLVLMPGVDTGGVSRKIEDATERESLKKLTAELKVPEGFGLIVRTAGVGQTKTELQRDMRYLLRLWESIQRASSRAEFPALVYRDADLVIRTIRDHFTHDISEVWIDSVEVHDKALNFMRDVMPSKAKAIRLYSDERPLFSKFNLEDQIERIYKRRVPLPSGGEIVIDGTEALTAIDVNSSRSRRKSDIEETILQTNLEAAAEAANQFKLRDLGGLIVIDFIDMYKKNSIAKVEKAMRDAMKADKAKYDVTKISKLGLMEIARQRLRGAKLAASYATCLNCDGHGLIKNVEASALAALRKIQTRTSRGNVSEISVLLPPEVAEWVQNNKREELLKTEQRLNLSIKFRSDPALLRHESTFTTTPRILEVPKEIARAQPTPEPRAVPSPAQPRIHDPAPMDAPKPAISEKVTAAEPDPSEEPRPRRKRRRRRRPRGAESPDTPEGVSPRESAEVRSNPSEGPVQERRTDLEDRVPRGVISNELMPAAAGPASRKRKPSGGRPSGRHRRGPKKPAP